MPNPSKIRSPRFWRRWCAAGAVTNVDGDRLDFWMLKRFRPRVHGARATVLVDGKPIGHAVGFRTVNEMRADLDLVPLEAPLGEILPVAFTMTFKRVPDGQP
jgi:hypothetical protein